MRYQRAFASRFRSLPIAGFAEPGLRQLPLLDIFVERSISSTRTPAGATPLSLVDLAREPRARLAVEGRAGSGKSAMVQHLALLCAAASTGEPEQPASLLAHWSSPPTPVLLDLPAIRAAHPDLIAADTDPLALIEAQLALHDLAAHMPAVRQALLHGEALVIADGATSTTMPLLTRLAAMFPANRFIITCRVCEDELLRSHGFQRTRLVELDRERADDLVARLLTTLNRRRPSLQFLSPLADRIAETQGSLQPDDGLRELITDPLAVTTAVQVVFNGHKLPESRAEVYRQMIESIWQMPHAPPLTLLEPLALAIHTRSIEAGHAIALPRSVIDDVLITSMPENDQASISRLLAHAIECGLLEYTRDPHDLAQDELELGMPRVALRSFLAAGAMARADDFSVRLKTLAASAAWRETLSLAVWRRQHTIGDALPLVHELLDTGQPQHRKGSGLHALNAPHGASTCNPALLAAECVMALGLQHDTSELPARTQQLLLGIIANPRLDSWDRVQAGMALERLGDPRFADLLPPMARIDAGVFSFGANVPGYDEEGPVQRVDLPTFEIGMFPVTNSEYARFLAANPSFPRPRYWFDPRFNGPSHPVIGVTWHQAMAYTEWLSQTLALAGRLPSGMVVRLPREEEWEKAATWGPRARRPHRFPWGDHWDSGMANLATVRTSADGRARWATTPVGSFPGGVSQYGVQDLIGNVWEWTASEFHGSASARSVFQSHHSYVLRGSAFNSTEANARATYRGSHLPPDYWRYNIGFRIVIARPLA